MEFEYRVTVIIPVYNAEQYLEDCLNSLLSQTIPQEEMEVLMINDGSADNSLEICERYAEEHENFRVLSQENQGVSAARNYGIRSAKGKYLMYLDSDDTLSLGTVKNVADFFDKHDEEVDIVTYRLMYCRESSKTSHWRYKYLKKSGVYDLEEYPYISQTTMNVCVKNKGEDNLLFDTHLKLCEDQIYNLKQTTALNHIGYCKEAIYFYVQHDGSASNKSHPYYEEAHPLYTFERFLQIQQRSKYSQAIVLYNLNWRIIQDRLYPYHFNPEAFNEYQRRLNSIIDQIDSDLILKHPAMDLFHKYYLLSLKTGCPMKLYYNAGTMALCQENHLLAIENTITAVFTKVKITDAFVEWHGFLKSPFFLFSPKPELYVKIITPEGSFEERLTLLDSAHGYYKSKIKTAQFWRFQFRVPSGLNGRISPRVCVNGYDMKLKYYFMPDLSFKTKAKNQTFYNQGTECTKRDLSFFVARPSEERQKKVKALRERWYWKNHKKFWLVRKLAMMNKSAKERVWLYSDSTGVGKDNGFYQFIHDIKQNDGITRYYITHDENFAQSGKFKGIPEKQIVLFHSKRHKFLYLQAEKIITAYIERYNYIPFDPVTYGHYRDVNDPEIIYLQHGVLHAHTPHKYSLDRLEIDREVVSTSCEIENLTGQYHFLKENLIPAGMPRYDYMDAHAVPQKGRRKILMAPSWRSYLISLKPGGIWQPEPQLFEKSEFYQSLQEFLSSETLAEILEKYDYTLDLKLHPLFQCYKDSFSFSNPRIYLSETNVDAAEYSVFISDFSSFTFDFVYLKRAILYFFPDYDRFRAGLMSYRKLNIPLEKGFGPLTENAGDALKELERILENEGKTEKAYQERMEGFFLFYDNNQTERIYQALIQQVNPMPENQKFEDMLAEEVR